ncbi:S66 family peptidase [Paenibacillus pseudetheri]|uniref:Microcin C7 self-immunity protein MccF n=1 Tax=Paenibacillus pseudetheri TaxID=2897682 RepID=A0ABN8FTG0_9BACL|nr:S66 peptidase family protein [Paenibacillus pseudetheri]CAH1058946.1 Microcin C7 self-immunity protein MccF [Paenibacillus pseudetheri]
MKPNKLKPGDELRIISPARSLSLIAAEQRKIAKEQLQKLGFRISFSVNSFEKDDFVSSSIESRVEDLHEAFLDPNVKGILTTIGGFNSNQLLRFIDYSIIAGHPKRLCGYSDITALSNAIYAKTGLVTYSGPHFSSFAMLHDNEYTTEYFRKLMMDNKEIVVKPSKHWSDDEWYRDQENRVFIRNEGPFIINDGEAKGTIIGGNLCTLNLLQGTEYMPSLKNSILFLEDDYESSPATFDRDLQSLIHQPDFQHVKGLVIGRFQQGSRMTKNLLIKIITSKEELSDIPVIADVDFGHTSPMITFPVGGQASLRAYGVRVELRISE